MSDWRDFKSVRVAKGEWMAFTDSAAQFIHQQVLELGYRHDPDLQTHRFAGSGDGALGGLTLKWVAVADEEPVSGEQPVPDISGLSLRQKTDLLAQLERDGIGGLGLHVPDPIEGAEVNE